MEDIFNIAGEINSTSQEGTAVHANQVKDDLQNKKQSQINEEVGEELELHTNRLNALTGQNYVTVVATQSTTAADIPTLINATGDGEQADTLYRVGFWDGSAYVSDKYTEYAWNGTAYVILDVKSSIGEVFDISLYKAVGGVLATFADLSAALNGGNNVPAGVRQGGMSIKFVQSNDNKYVQYRYMGTAVTGNPNPFLDTANWQKQGAEVSVSQNTQTQGTNVIIGGESVADLANQRSVFGVYNNNKESVEGEWYKLEFIAGNKYRITNTSDVGYVFNAWTAMAEDLNERIDQLCNNLAKGASSIITATENASYLRIGSTSGAVSFKIENLDAVDVRLKELQSFVKEISDKIDGVYLFNKSGTEGKFVPFNFFAGHSYQIFNLSEDANTITVTVAYDNTTIPAEGEILCADLSSGRIGTVVEVSTDAPFIRLGSTSSPAIIAMFDVSILYGKFISDMLNSALKVDDASMYRGVATPTTTPPNDNIRGFYFATQPGDYTHFSANNDAGYIKIGAYCLNIIYKNSNQPSAKWSLITLSDIASKIPIPIKFKEYGAGRISVADGSVIQVDDNSARYTIIPIEPNMGRLTFTANISSGAAGYGFLVNGVWQGFLVPTSQTVSVLTIDVPVGATEFRTWWNKTLIPENHIYFYALLAYNNLVNSATEVKKQYAGIQFTPDFVLSRVPQMPTPSKDAETQDIYDLYDGLMATYPSYISKLNLSNYFSELDKPSYLDEDILAYRFLPKRTGDYNKDAITTPIKVMIVTGTHPDEWFNIYTTYQMMKMICENWNTDVNCEFVRSFVGIYVIPVLNPWGFDHSSRVNGNRVNLNRNFPTTNWTYIADSSALNYSGDSPASEYETKILMAYANIIKPIVFIDGHTPRMDAQGHRGCFICMDNDFIINLGDIITKTASNQFRKDDSNYPNIDTQLYYIESHTDPGEEFQWVAEQKFGAAYDSYGLSVLLEGGESNRWVDGVLTDNDSELQTAKLMRENLQYYFNALLRMTKEAVRKMLI